MSLPTIDEHPHAALASMVRPENVRHVATGVCPGCGNVMKKFGEWITLHDVTGAAQPLVALSAICWRCAHRVEHSPKQRQKILHAVRQTMRLAVDVGGHA